MLHLPRAMHVPPDRFPPLRTHSMNYRFTLPLMTTAVLEQTVVSIVRVTTTYRSVELDLSVAWLGAISAAIAILPLMFAVPIGRYIDRGHETRTAAIGAGILCVA